MCPACDSGISDLGHSPEDVWLQHHPLRSSTVMLLSNSPASNTVAAVRGQNEIQALCVLSEDADGVRKFQNFVTILCPHNLLNPVLFSRQRSNTMQSFLSKGCPQVCHLSFSILLPLSIPNSVLLCLAIKSTFMMQLRVYLVVVRLKQTHFCSTKHFLAEACGVAVCQYQHPNTDSQSATGIWRTLWNCLSVMCKQLGYKKMFLQITNTKKFNENKDTFLSGLLSSGVLNSLFKVRSITVKSSVRKWHRGCFSLKTQNVVYSTQCKVCNFILPLFQIQKTSM